MLYYKRIARYIGLYVRYDGAVMELTSDVFFAVWENRLELPEIRNLMLISTGSPNSRH